MALSPLVASFLSWFGVVFLTPTLPEVGGHFKFQLNLGHPPAAGEDLTPIARQTAVTEMWAIVILRYGSRTSSGPRPLVLMAVIQVNCSANREIARRGLTGAHGLFDRDTSVELSSSRRSSKPPCPWIPPLVA